MAEWSREKVNPSDLNNGNEWEQGDRVAREELNAMVNAGLYAQDFAEHLADTPDTSDAGSIGTPSVTLIDNVVNGITYKKFKFSNLKGEKGDKGDTGLSGGYNPNLLINGDFRVNQRGLTIYKSQTSANIYSLDHWQIGTNATGVTVATKSGEATNYGGGIILSCTSDVPSSYNILRQFIEDYEILQGKTLTLSCYVSNLSGSLNLRIFGTNLIKSQSLQSGLNIMSVTIPSDITRLYIAISCLGVESSATLEWVKLEIGSVATLFSPRPYAEELALCQRYYQKYSPSNNYSLIALGYVYESMIIIYGITLAVVMRTTPTIQRSGNLYIRSYSFTKVIYPTDDILFSVHGMCNNMIQVQVSTSSFTFNNGEMTILRVSEETAYLSLDAEIYQ